MNRSLIRLVALLLLLGLAGCATIRGMGEDIQNLGRGIKKTVSD